MKAFGNMRVIRQRASNIIGFALLGGCICICSFAARGQNPSARGKDWRAVLNEEMPLLGHRNWILIVDSAYPLQSSPGVQTVETGYGESEVVREVLDAINHSIHVRPVIYMDAELPFVPERDAPGVTRYREQMKAELENYPITSVLHEDMLQKIGDSGKSFHVLILKTNETIPYTSVFIQLNCKYWSDAAEARVRAAMKQVSARSHP